MKQVSIVLSFLLIAVPGYSQTNIYYPLPTQNAAWREYQGSHCDMCRDYQNFTAGDTVIGGKSYTKIWSSGIYYSSNFYGFCTNTIVGNFSYLSSAIRNDSINKKVYSYDFYNHVETLLYDFNLNLGDTVPVQFSSGYVSAIDSVLVGQNYHKRFTVSEINSMLPDVYLIEGIGATSGLLNRIDFCFECCTSLLCVKQNDTTIYPDGWVCDLIEGIPENSTPALSFRLSPNPCEDFATISVSPATKDLSFSLYDPLGNIILQKFNVINGERIDLTSVKPGFYYYNLSHSHDLARAGKLIKR